MPTPFIKKAAAQTHESKKHLEHVFKKVEKSAKKSGATNPYAVATAIVEKVSGYHPSKK
jgi:hypothetical protein